MVIPSQLQHLLASDAAVARLGAAFAAKEIPLYLVGGTVRDAFLGVELAGDLDFATPAPPERIDEILSPLASAVWRQGMKFGTVGAHLFGADVEITTFRADHYRDESRKPEVSFSETIEEDLLRRDFTVNAMALAVHGTAPALIDPFGGMDDLIAKVLRTPQDPHRSFEDDPLRMLRAARFMSQIGFTPDAALRDAVMEMRARLSIVSAERIRDELSKLLLCEDPSAGLWFLADTKLSDEFFPELRAMRVEQDPIHRHKDVLAHTIAVVNNTRPELRVRLAALCHDIAKPKTRAIGEHGVSFHHHEVVGARMTTTRLRALKYPNDLVDEVKQLVYLHLRIHTYAMGWTDAAVRRYVRDAGELLEDLNHLQRCDCTTRNPRRAEELQARMDDLEARIAALAEQEELNAIRPPLDGNEIMEYLQLPPGRMVGQALAYLLEERLERGPIEPSDAYVLLDQWANDRGIPVPPSE